jgi:hypothetical protein
VETEWKERHFHNKSDVYLCVCPLLGLLAPESEETVDFKNNRNYPNKVNIILHDT